MKNITVSIPDEVAHWVRVWAARNDASVSSMLSGLLRDKMEKERHYQAAMRAYLDRAPAVISDGVAYPSRESA